MKTTQAAAAPVKGQHTPGPWKQVGGTEVWEERCVYRICNCGGSYGPPVNAMRANARLIAAAPALVEALEACEDVIGMAQLQGKLSDNAFSPVISALVKARKALDLLRG